MNVPKSMENSSTLGVSVVCDAGGNGRSEGEGITHLCGIFEGPVEKRRADA